MGRMPLGVRQFVFRGDLTVLLGPPTKQPPFFGGMVMYFVNTPTIDIDFTGVTSVADMKAVKNTITNVINTQVGRIAVLPSNIAVEMGPHDDHGEMLAGLRCPEPIGVLRFLLRGGDKLRAADGGTLSAKSSDPYAVVEIGRDQWRSHTVNKTVSPIWLTGN